MKKTLLSLMGIMLLCGGAFAQAPNSMPFQGALRDASGNITPYQNTTQCMRFSIYNGDPSLGGTLVYQETQPATTNKEAQFTAYVGEGTVTSGSFSAIGFNSSAVYIKVELNSNATCTGSYTVMGTQQMKSVPFAINALNAANAAVQVNPALTGNGTTASKLDLATVYSGAGTVGSATIVPQLTVNNKGQITGEVDKTITAAGIGAITLTSLSATSPVSYNNATGNISLGTVNVGNGGTGVTSYSIGDITYASASTTLSKLSDVATGNALISGGTGTAPSWGKIGLTTHVSGILPLANGGTGVDGTSTAINTVFAGPATGSAGSATFRSLATADLPAIGQTSASGFQTTQLTPTTAGFTLIPGMTVTLTVPAGYNVMLSAGVPLINNTGTTQSLASADIAFFQDGSSLAQGFSLIDAGNNTNQLFTWYTPTVVVISPTAASHTYALGAQKVSGASLVGNSTGTVTSGWITATLVKK